MLGVLPVQKCYWMSLKKTFEDKEDVEEDSVEIWKSYWPGMDFSHSTNWVRKLYRGCKRES